MRSQREEGTSRGQKGEGWLRRWVDAKADNNMEDK